MTLLKANAILLIVFVVLVSFWFANVVQYDTERETHLYNNVEQTVDFPWFWVYQDLLASYAYNTCLVKLPWESGKYSCENLVKTWNAENWGRRWNAVNNSNSNGTHDGWLCQLNSAYHMKFIQSKWFKNPLAQLDYCLQVRVDAKNKWKMPWYAFHVRNKRDKGIVFAWIETIPNEPTDLPAIWEPIQTWCRWVATAKENERIQIDMHYLEKFVSILFNWVVGSNKKAMIFICDN